MPIELKMPALAPTMEEGTLAKWLVSEGDEITAGDLIAEIETDKATMEFEAVDEGVLAKILVEEGTDEVKVGTPTVEGASVTAKVVDHFRGDKITTFKMKRRQRSRIKQGYRHSHTTLEITAING